MIRVVLIALMLCWPFGRRAAPSAPQRAAGHWEYVPHIKDGYWVEYAWRGNGADRTLVLAKDAGPDPEWSYPFHRFVWEWPGYKLGDATVCIETFPGDKLDKPKSPYWIPGYDPFMPGQKYNL